MESIVHVAACECSEESLERHSPEVAEDGSCASLRSRAKKEIDKMLRSRRTTRYPQTQKKRHRASRESRK